MDVLKTSSDLASPSKPCPLPRKTRPSSSSNVARLFIIYVSGPPATSIEATHFIDRPVSENGFPVDVFLRYLSPHAAVVGLIPVVAENVIVTGLDRYRRIGAVIQEFRQEIGLIQLLVVHVDDSAANLNDIAGHADHPLDVGFRRIERVPEHDNVLPLDLFNVVDELVDENAFLVNEFREHAGSFNLYRLIQENNDQNSRADGEEYIAGPSANFSDDAGYRD